jgi:hypothetical protein
LRHALAELPVPEPWNGIFPNCICRYLRDSSRQISQSKICVDLFKWLSELTFLIGPVWKTIVVLMFLGEIEWRSSDFWSENRSSSITNLSFSEM